MATRTQSAARRTARWNRILAVRAAGSRCAATRTGADPLWRERARRYARAYMAWLRAAMDMARQRRIAWLAARPRGREAVRLRGALPTNHRAGVASTVARRLVDQHRTRRTRPGMARLWAGMVSTRKRPATDSTARYEAALLERRKRLCCLLGRESSAKLRAAEQSLRLTTTEAGYAHRRRAWRTWAGMTHLRGASVPRTAALARAPARMGHRMTTRLRDAPAPAAVRTWNRFLDGLARGAAPMPPLLLHIRVLVHAKLLLHLLHAALRPRTYTRQVQNGMAPRARPDGLLAQYGVVTNSTVVLVRGQFRDQART